MLECVINISEGTNTASIVAIADAGGTHTLDVHSDPDHNRTVITLGGPEVADAARAVASAAIERIDIANHTGVHPRIGAIDVVPFIDLEGNHQNAESARDTFAQWFWDTHGVPCFTYGSHRTLPDIRKRAFVDLFPDCGNNAPHPKAGAAAVGQRPLMVAYNLWLAGVSLEKTREIARNLRSNHVRAIGLEVGTHTQVSCNLIEPHAVGPKDIYDQVATEVAIERCELVGLVPRGVLKATPKHRLAELDLAEERTIEARIADAALNTGKVYRSPL